MYREITLPQDTRCFQRIEQSNRLTFQGTMRRKGDTLTVGPPEQIWYDHRLQKAVSFELDNKTYYMLVSELKILELACE